ncbi:MAG: TVP38/TMEM64 family protein [Clostridia bacterium]|nr:TVP38/TMEM64 family protein [Clostridia bacterium]
MQRKDSDGFPYEKALKVIKLFLEILVLFAIILVTVHLFPLVMKLKEEDVRHQVRVFVSDSGIWGVLCMLGIQLAQVVLSVIPGEPVEVLFGFIYGPWLGALLCLISIALGSFAVYTTTRALGKNFMLRIEKSGKYDKFSFLRDPKRRDALIFFLFFLPGTPKDTITYFVPFTKMELGKFLTISTIARIPSVITSTFAGESIFSGNYISSVVIFIVTGVIGIAGIIIYNRMTSNKKTKT